jgi:IclR family KDG regulon transcriptional repressor
LSQSVRSVERALEILLCFSSETPELTMTQIAERVGIHKSTAHRLLATLEQKQFLERDPVSGVYRPGIRILQMAYRVQEHNDLRQLAAPFLRKLAAQHRENVNLSILDDGEVFYLEVVESPQRVKLAATSGMRLPAFCTASGKAIIAFLPPETLETIIEGGLSQHTENTITDQEAFLKNIKQTREQGYAISLEEFEDGINAIAVPIFDKNDQPIASISVAGPAFRMSKSRMEEIAPMLKTTANYVSLEVQLGFQSPNNGLQS